MDIDAFVADEATNPAPALSGAHYPAASNYPPDLWPRPLPDGISERKRRSNRSQSLSLDSPNRKRADVKSTPAFTALPEIKPNMLPSISLES